MLRKVVASTLILGSTVLLNAPTVQAQSTDVQFNVSVATNCIFQQNKPGVLAISSGSVLTANNSTGTQGSVGFVCSGPANITVSAPRQVAGPTFTPSACSAAISRPSGAVVAQVTTCGGTSSPGAISGQDTLNVDMSVASSSLIPAGDYSYSVTLTIAP
jgi:hypothetical protein